MNSAVFDDRPTLQGPTLALRPLSAGDLAGLYAAASRPQIWAGHPASDRYKEDVFQGYFQFLLDRGGALGVIDREKIGAVHRYDAVLDLSGNPSSNMCFSVVRPA